MMQLATRIAAVAAVAAMATGCATASTSTPAAAGGTSGTGAASASPPASASASAAPVPTTTTGPPIVAGQPACAGWPGNVTRSKTLPGSFVPVSVIRCVTDYQMIPGKGQWETATLERADQGFATLLTALRRPNQARPPGTFCSDIVVLPPQFVLVGKDGQAIWPTLPVTGCGMVQAEVLGALAALPWQKVSVRLLAKV
jgi:hypothetical protein